MFDGTVSITSNGGDAVIAVSGVAGKSVANWDTDLDGDGEADWPAGWQEAHGLLANPQASPPLHHHLNLCPNLLLISQPHH